MGKKKKGFTLIELIAVIAILSILAGIIIPNVISYVETSEKTKIKSEAKIVLNIYYERKANEKAFKEGANGINLGNLENSDVFDVTGPLPGVSQVSNYVALAETLGMNTTMAQLKEIIDMPLEKIPVKNGALPQINGQAVLN